MVVDAMNTPFNQLQTGAAALISSRTHDLYDPHILFLQFVSVYVVLQAFSAALGIGLFHIFSYAVAVLMLFVLALRPFGKQSSGLDGMEYILPLLLYYYGLFGSIAYNFGELDWPATIKFVLTPFFFLIGAKIESLRPTNVIADRKTWIMFGLIAFLPFAVLMLQLVKGVDVFARGAEFSLFANRNNGALYAVALLGLYHVYAQRPLTNVFIYMAVGASFGTLGVLIAIIFSLMLLVAKRNNLIRYTVVLVIAAASMVVLVINDVWMFARFKPVIGTLELLTDPHVQFASLSYEWLYHHLHTTDLSLAFRIKHWLDLIDIYTSAPMFNWLFGMGIGASSRLSQAMLPPHNDFLRVLFECGIVTFVGFASLLAIMLKKMGRRWETVPFFTIVLYMISENLIDNFLAMVIFYYAGGVLIYRLQRAEQAHTRGSRAVNTGKQRE